MSCLHIFDMDGTLLHGSACIEISRAVGMLDENIAIERAWANGEFSDNRYWEKCLPLWHKLTDEHIDNAFSAAPWLDGVKSVFADIRSRNEYSVVITQSPQFFAERLTRWGVSFAFGAEVSPGDAGGAQHMVTSDDKLSIARKLLTELDLTDEDCIAYGDSLSDLALFESLTHSVAVNAKQVISRLASVSYEGADLWAAYLAGRKLVDSQRVH